MRRGKQRGRETVVSDVADGETARMARARTRLRWRRKRVGAFRPSLAVPGVKMATVIQREQRKGKWQLPPRLNLNGIAASQHDGASRANTRHEGVIISDINDIRKLIGAAS